MIVSKYIADEIDPSRFPNAPSPKARAIKRFASEGISFVLSENPAPIGLAPIVCIPFSLLAFNDDDEYIYAVSIEKSDLRELANLIGVPLKELQEEEGVKGFYSLPHIVMYGDDKREDLGIFQERFTRDNIADILMEYAIDSLDIIEEPKEVPCQE